MSYFFENIRRTLFVLLLTLVIPLSSFSADTENDPFESTNRNIFKFNNVLDDNFFKPVAKGWRKIPDIPRKPLSNLASTAQAPISLANAILQLNRESIGNILAKFLINMTFGLGGLFDVASTDNFGNMPNTHEDFGQTLGAWGIEPGPYLILPILGPTSTRDLGGKVGDWVVDPVGLYLIREDYEDLLLAANITKALDTRVELDGVIEGTRKNSLDPYAIMRTMYLQRRARLVANEESEDTSIYDIDIDVMLID